MGEIVSKKWQMVGPHGTPMTLIEDGKYILVQAMVKESEETDCPLVQDFSYSLRIAEIFILIDFFGGISVRWSRHLSSTTIFW